jgi:CheY-like chemotaxis protein
MVVEDQIEVLGLLQRMLERYGYRVIPCASGTEAMDIYRVRKDEVDLIILDMVMPDKSGREVCEEIMKVNPSERILFSSGYGLDGTLEDILRLGAKGFVQKPYRPRDLAYQVRQVLDAE